MKKLSVSSMKRSLSVLSGVFVAAVWLMVLPSVGAAYSANFVMTSFQGESNPLYLSGQIDYTYNGTPNFGFCANNSSAELYLNQPYYGALTSIQANQPLLEAAYLMATYDPNGSPNISSSLLSQFQGDSLYSTWGASVYIGVVLQTAIWDVTNQSYTNYGGSYTTLYANAGAPASAAENATGLAGYAQSYGLLQLWSVNSDGSLGQPNQGLATIVPTGIEPMNGTPIPPAILLLGPGLVGIAALRRRFTK